MYSQAYLGVLFSLYLQLYYFACAQFPPTPEGVTILKSKFDENITISYKEESI